MLNFNRPLALTNMRSATIPSTRIGETPIGNPPTAEVWRQTRKGDRKKQTLSLLFCCQRAAGVSTHSVRGLCVLVNDQPSCVGVRMTVEYHPGRPECNFLLSLSHATLATIVPFWRGL